MSDHDPTGPSWPTYALRAWLAALLAETRRVRHDLVGRIDAAEKEAARLRRQHERSATVIESLEDSIARVDARLRPIRDTDPPRPAETHEPEHAHPEPHPNAEHREVHDKPSERAAAKETAHPLPRGNPGRSR